VRDEQIGQRQPAPRIRDIRDLQAIARELRRQVIRMVVPSGHSYDISRVAGKLFNQAGEKLTPTYAITAGVRGFVSRGKNAPILQFIFWSPQLRSGPLGDAPDRS